MALSNNQRNAVAKAVEINGAALVERVQYGIYRVPSASSNRSYLVTVHGAEYVCDCTAGQHAKACWHAAAVLIAKVERASRARVIGPVPVPATATGPTAEVKTGSAGSTSPRAVTITVRGAPHRPRAARSPP